MKNPRHMDDPKKRGGYVKVSCSTFFPPSTLLNILLRNRWLSFFQSRTGNLQPITGRESFIVDHIMWFVAATFLSPMDLLSNSWSQEPLLQMSRSSTLFFLTRSLYCWYDTHFVYFDFSETNWKLCQDSLTTHVPELKRFKKDFK